MDKFIQILEENDIKPEDIESLKARPAPVVQFKLWRENTLRTPGDYCFSTPYLLACAAHRINPARWQDPETRENPEIRKFMQRIQFSIIIDEESFGLAKLEDAGSLEQGIEVMAKGQIFRAETACVGGSCQIPEFRNTDEELVRKFRDNTSNVLPLEKTEKVAQSILELEKVDDLGQLLGMVAPQ